MTQFELRNMSRKEARHFVEKEPLNPASNAENGNSTNNSQSAILKELTIDNCNKKTRVYNDIEKDRVIYVFEYGNTVLSHKVLKNLRDKNQWNVIKHPFVFNYINEVLLRVAWLYTLHILMYFVFLLFLYSFIHAKTLINEIAVTVLSGALFFFMVLKVRMKREKDGSKTITRRFVLSYAFSFFTYVVTFSFIWVPKLLEYDDYYWIKEIVNVVLPVVAIVASWIQCLYVLRKSPYGLYVMMMAQILKSFLNTMVIWVPTVVCFAYAFEHIMEGSGIAPWDEPASSNSTFIMNLIVTLSKTSTMMIGEIGADDILKRGTWFASFLLLFFEIVSVILLMNLVISLAVGDVSELRDTADEKLLKIKTSYCIDALHYFEMFGTKTCQLWRPRNVAVIGRNKQGEFNVIQKLVKKPVKSQSKNTPLAESITNLDSTLANTGVDQTYEIIFKADNVRFEQRSSNEPIKITILGTDNTSVKFNKMQGCEIYEVTNPDYQTILQVCKDKEGYPMKFSRWIIGLNWNDVIKS